MGIDWLRTNNNTTNDNDNDNDEQARMYHCSRYGITHATYSSEYTTSKHW